MRNKRKRKRKDPAAQSAPPEPKPQGITTAFGPLLERAGLDRLAHTKKAAAAAAAGKVAQPSQNAPQRAPASPAPLQSTPRARAAEPELSQRELSLLHRAYQGVQRIDRPKRGRVDGTTRRAAVVAASPDASEDAAARARLSDLVGGGVRFEVRWDEGFVEGLRAGQTPKLLARLRGSGFAPEAQLDLHGLRRDDVQRAVWEFVRRQHRLGRRYVLIITGKGQHSEGGRGVLGEALAETLAGGGAAPFVLAFASAHVRHGGRGAVAVMFK
jgi:DNA-nicking Smr family endonuclease